MTEIVIFGGGVIFGVVLAFCVLAFVIFVFGPAAGRLAEAGALDAHREWHYEHDGELAGIPE